MSTLWLCQSVSNIKIIQRFQDKVLRNVVNAPRYTCDSNLSQDLGMETVAKIIDKTTACHEQRLHSHVNAGAIQLPDNAGLKRRLKRTKPFEFVYEVCSKNTRTV